MYKQALPAGKIPRVPYMLHLTSLTSFLVFTSILECRRDFFRMTH